VSAAINDRRSSSHLYVPEASPTSAQTESVAARTLSPQNSARRLDVGSDDRLDQEFAEPVSLSSTTPANFPLPRTAARFGFVLLALRARRSPDSSRRSADDVEFDGPDSVAASVKV
jgi:hypothetical protein